MRTLRKVLVVDDDPVVGKSFDRVLSNKGYAVITAANGEEALRKIAAENYDVVYTDIRMPGMDGIEVAERIKGRQPWLPVVIVTGFGSDENVARANAAGVATVLHKPLTPEMIEGSARIAVLERDVAAPPTEGPVALLVPPVTVAEEETETGGVKGVLKIVGIGLAAPFVGLAYVIAFPMIGLAMLLWNGVNAVAKRAGRIARFVKDVALFVAAPFVGLAYTIALPFVGLGMLTWWGAKALFKRPDGE